MPVPQGYFYEGMSLLNAAPMASDEFYQYCGKFNHCRVRHPDHGQGVQVYTGEWAEVWQPISMPCAGGHGWLQVSDSMDGWVLD